MSMFPTLSILSDLATGRPAHDGATDSARIGLTAALAANRPAAPRPLLRLPHAGMLAGTLVETETGWQPVETLAIGQRVQTWDGGLQPLTGLARQRIAPAAALVSVPGGVLSTCSELLLLPGQHLLVATGAAAEFLDCDRALVPAAALEGWNGIALVRPRQAHDVVTLSFDAEEAVYANTGALIHCAPDTAEAAPRSDFFTVLDRAGARALFGLDAPGPGGSAADVPGRRRAA